MSEILQSLSGDLLSITDAQLGTLHDLARLEDRDEWIRDVRIYHTRVAPLAATSRVREPAPDLESRALSMLTDDQAYASFYRWQEALNGAKVVHSLREQLGVDEYVAAIYAKVPA